MRASFSTGLVGRSRLNSLPGGGGDGSGLLAFIGERDDDGVCADGDLGVWISETGDRTAVEVVGDRSVGGGGGV